MFKKIFTKKQKAENEEEVELTPEELEKKAKVKKTLTGVAKTVGAMAVGAGLTIAAIIGIGAKTASNDSDESEGSDLDSPCATEDVPVDSPEE